MAKGYKRKTSYVGSSEYYGSKNLPKIMQKPQLADYGLPPNAEYLVNTEKEKIRQKYAKINKRRTYIVLGALLVCIALSYKYLMEWIMCSGAVIFVVLLIIVAVEKNPEAVPVEYETQLIQYQKDCKAYEYWLGVKKFNAWDSLDGHSFERAVARLYEGFGYSTTVSREGGDGGIDIILKKDNDVIAVQCKAHNKAVGPAVARDLYGTMVSKGYKHGMIVSKNGFTKGVHEFIAGKNIELVDLQQLMEMQDHL